MAGATHKDATAGFDPLRRKLMRVAYRMLRSVATPRTVSSDVCDLILHHARKGVTASHYDFSTLKGPMRKALQDWADYVCSIAGQGAAGGNIVSLKRA
jgi:hypothetical protein